MPYTFTFDDIKKICRRLGMEQAAKGSKTWRGIGPDGKFRQTYIHSHGDGGSISTGTARQIAQQLLFTDLEDMTAFLNNKNRRT
jgi:hypothetical protein